MGEAPRTNRGTCHVGEALLTNRGIRHVNVICPPLAAAAAAALSPLPPHRSLPPAPAMGSHKTPRHAMGEAPRTNRGPCHVGEALPTNRGVCHVDTRSPPVFCRSRPCLDDWIV